MLIYIEIFESMFGVVSILEYISNLEVESTGIISMKNEKETNNKFLIKRKLCEDT